MIAKYFDAPTEKCSICDNCIQQRKKTVSTDDFNTIEKTIIQQIPKEGIDINILLKQNIFSKDKFWKVLLYLEDQEIIVTINGVIYKLTEHS